MDPLLEKFLNDEITDEQFNEELNKLTPEQQAVLQEQAKTQKASDFESLKAIRQEKKRNQELADQAARDAEAARSNGGSATDYGATFRNEQIKIAKQKFFNKFEIPEAERAHYDEQFEKSGSQNVSADLIYKDLTRIYAAEHAEDLIQSRERLTDFEKDAAEFNAEGAGAQGGGNGGGDSSKKYPPQAYTLVAQARKEGKSLTLDEADRYLRRGGERTLA